MFDAFFVWNAPALGPLWCVFPFAGMALVVAVAGMALATKRVHVGTLVWACVFALLQGFIGLWCAQGLLLAPKRVLLAFCLAATAAGLVVLLRERLAALIDRLAKAPQDTAVRVGRHGVAAAEPVRETSPRPLVISIVRDVLLLLLAAWLAFYALEMPYNPLFDAIAPGKVAFALVVIGLAMATLYFLAQRRGGAAALVVVLCAFIGIAQSFLDRVKNTALLPSDLLALGTAAAVSGNYTYTLDTSNLTGIIVGIGSLVCLAFIMPPHSGWRARMPWRTLINVALAAACGGGLFAFLTVPNYGWEWNYHLDYWDLRNNYYEIGFIPAFTIAGEDLVIDRPENYSDAAADKLQEDYAAAYDARVAEDATNAATQATFEAQKPCVVAIMNETYSDLSILENLHAGYTGPRFLQNTPAGTIERGWASVSVHGGGTCNTEFEFLTGDTIGYLGFGMYPFQQFNFSGLDTLPRRFAQLGYHTTGMHPNLPGNWNRDNVYRMVGFDDAYFIDAFEGEPEFHSGVEDAATYRKVLQILQDESAPQFVFDVTMQNHSGYDKGNIPPEYQQDYYCEELDEATNAQMNEFVACIEKSDDDFEWFLGELEKLDRPVIVLMWGDHQPNFTKTINQAFFPEEEADDYLQWISRIYKTPYIIWANYDVTGTVNVQEVPDVPTESAEGMPAESEAPAVEGEAPETAFPLMDASVLPVTGLVDQTTWGSDVWPGPAWKSTHDISVNYLGAELMRVVGAPLGQDQKAELELYWQMPVINSFGYTDEAFAWHSFEDEPRLEAVNVLEMLQYRNLVRKL